MWRKTEGKLLIVSIISLIESAQKAGVGLIIFSSFNIKPKFKVDKRVVLDVSHGKHPGSIPGSSTTFLILL